VKAIVSLALFVLVTVSVTGDRRVNATARPLESTGSAGGELPGWPADEWVFPGEYESHQAMWMLWPTYENKAGFPSTEVVGDMIQAMSGHTHVNLAVQDADDEAAAREWLGTHGVPLDHVHFFHLEHLDLWARDMGPPFVRSLSGRLRVTDWNFNYWGYEEPESFNSSTDEPFDRTAAAAIGVPVVEAQPSPRTGVRFIHEGGSVSHNGQGTMIAVESVVMQRNMGPNRFCGGQAPVTDFSRPNTYAPNPDWPACRVRVEAEYRRMLGARKFIWIPTGIIEDSGTFRGALAKHIRLQEFDGITIPHTGVYTMYGTNGHADDFLRFVGPDTVVLAQENLPRTIVRTPEEELIQWLGRENHDRLQRAYEAISGQTTASGQPIRVVRMPSPVPTLDVTGPGDGTYEYFAAYDRWEDGSTTPEVMLGVWAASYVNYVPTNDLVMVSKFWKPGRSLEIKKRDDEAVSALKRLFPGREIVQVYSENVNRGGGGLNCISQQQPASGKFARMCGWAKVKVDVQIATLYAQPFSDHVVGRVPRLTRLGRDVYLERLSTAGKRVQVRVVWAAGVQGEVAWIDADDIESAGEMCPAVYSPN
jgi:agmatine deiminase